MDKMLANLPNGFRVLIDHSTDNDSSSAGLLWHAELNGMPLPNGKVGVCAKGTLIFLDTLGSQA